MFEFSKPEADFRGDVQVGNLPPTFRVPPPPAICEWLCASTVHCIRVRKCSNIVYPVYKSPGSETHPSCPISPALCWIVEMDFGEHSFLGSLGNKGKK
jgi:hypothetical protein